MMSKYPFEVVSIRLVRDAPLMSKAPILNPQDAVKLVGDLLCELDREVLCVINRRVDGVPINCSIVSIGALNESLAHPREIMKSAILTNAASLIMVHNHPSGKLSPSKYDTIITERMIQVCELMGITLDDHIIVGGDNSQYFSFREKELLNYTPLTFNTDYTQVEFASPKVAENQEEPSQEIPKRVSHRRR